MALLTPEQCRAQCRVDGEYADTELADLLVSAEAAASAYLNCATFDAQAALDAALEALPGQAAAARASYAAALAAADAEPDEQKAQTMRMVAEQRLANANLAGQRVLYGIVADGSILAAVRLILGHLWANREAVVVGDTATEIPMGAVHLLRPYRRVQSP